MRHSDDEPSLLWTSVSREHSASSPHIVTREVAELRGEEIGAEELVRSAMDVTTFSPR